MRECFICHEYVDETAKRCNRCGAVLPKFTASLPDAPPRYALPAAPRKSFIGGAFHALLFSDAHIHDVIIQKKDRGWRVLSFLFMTPAAKDGFDSLFFRREWPGLKALPVSRYSERFRVDRSIPYSSIAWVGLKPVVLGVQFIIALRSGNAFLYNCPKLWSGFSPEEIYSDLKGIFGQGLVWADDYAIPPDRYEV